MKTRIAQLVSGVGIEPTHANGKGYSGKDLQACKPHAANTALLLAFALTVLAAPAFAQERSSLKLPATVFVLSQAADWHSTQMALSNGTGREANPLMRVGSGEMAAIKAGTTIAIVYAAHRLNRHHPRVAKALLWTGSVVTFSVAAHNYSLARRAHGDR